MAIGDPVVENKVAIGGTSTATTNVLDSSLGNRALYVRLFADTDCFATWNENPTALNDGTDGMPMESGQPEYKWIRADYKIAVIERT